MIGINLLREGIDLPEVAVVAILDADKEGFLRSERSLVQTAGRAARTKAGRAILYADEITPSMQKLIDQTNARRERQIAYNREHGIVPETIRKGKTLTISEIVAPADDGGKKKMKMPKLAGNMFTDATDISELGLSDTDLDALIAELTGEMRAAAESLEFERAADLRDQIRKLRPPEPKEKSGGR